MGSRPLAGQPGNLRVLLLLNGRSRAAGYATRNDSVAHCVRTDESYRPWRSNKDVGAAPDSIGRRVATERSVMLANSKAYSGFAVDDVARAKQFYTETLGLRVSDLDAQNGLFELQVGGERPILVYQKPDFTPATYTILNFPVDDIDKIVDELTARGVSFEKYEGFGQDEKGIARDQGPSIAWFRDPAGNIMSVIEETPAS
jgi:catechol 2,3-dioxygenase-like lactoylglutathione lyase family enzyme